MISKMLQRRNFIKALSACGIAGLIPATMPTPALSITRPYQLTAGKSAFNISGSKQADTDMWLYNGSCPGPLLRLRRGEILRAEVTNQLDVPTTVHWHGIRNINDMDGVADLTQAPIEPGESFTYEFPVNHSGTFWYHAHTMSWQQVARGLYGPLIIDDDDDPVTDHDICLMIDDWRLDDKGQIHQSSLGSLHDWSHAGRLGNWLTVNAQSDPAFSVKPGARVRLRLINAANARVLTLRFDGVEAQLVALDGAPCRAETINTIKLAPAQRADVICDLVTEKAFIREISTGTDHPAGHFVATQELGKATAPKNAINTALVPPLPDLRQVRRITVHMQGGAMGNLTEARYDGAVLPLRELAQKHKKLWAFNGQIGDYNNIFAEIDLGSVVSLDVINDTAWPHAMHLHGHHFWVMSDDPTVDLPSGQRDTWLMQPQERASLVFVADNPGLWLFHCHMLEHAAAGMGAVLSID